MKKKNFGKLLFAALSAFAVSMPSMARSTMGVASQPFKKDRPKIVVGMVVDQMCWDYLYRYQKAFGQGGFLRLLNDGFNCDNTLLNYIPSVTAIGHSTIYTGSVPAIHGMAGNDFEINNKVVYCTEDNTVHAVGAPDTKDGRQSPRNLLVTTVSDELRLATNFRSKVISVSIKDRASILPGGHLSNGSYWFDNVNGDFITSTYYMKQLPKWVNDFNAQRWPDKYLSEKWNTLYPRSRYQDCTADNSPYEKAWDKETPATLPLDLPALKKKFGYNALRTTPMGNTMTLQFAEAAMKGERLGMTKGETDFLAISLSCTDYIGHRYGVDALETEDCYLRLDQDLAKFFNFLDRTYGKDNYVFFITADHAAAHNPSYMMDKNVPAGGFRTDIAKTKADSVAKALYPQAAGVVNAVMNYQVFLNSDIVKKYNVDEDKLLKKIGDAIDEMPGVAYTVDARHLNEKTLPHAISMRIRNGYRPGRSGDMFIVLNPGWLKAKNDRPQGTSHGVWAPYDTHIPLIFMGKNIPARHLHRQVYMTDIAPTLSQMLYIQTPNGCIGQPIYELLKE